MVFRFLKKPKADIEVIVDPVTASPGSDLDVSVSISTGKGFEVREAVARLRCIETYWKMEYDAGSKSTRKKKKRRNLVDAPTEFISNGKVDDGVGHRQTLKLKLPEDAPPTVEGKSANIAWTARVSIDVPGARDLHSDEPFTVLPLQSPEATSDDPESIVATSSNDELGISLQIPDRLWKPGDAIDGELQVSVSKDCTFPEVRIELEVKEKAGAQNSTVTADKLVLDTDASFRRGLGREWRFSLSLPESHRPTLDLSDTEINWRVKAVFARSMRRDYVVEQAITVG